MTLTPDAEEQALHGTGNMLLAISQDDAGVLWCWRWHWWHVANSLQSMTSAADKRRLRHNTVKCILSGACFHGFEAVI